MEKNPREMWLENLQRQHQPTSPPVSNLPRSTMPHAAFLSTPQYVRLAAATAGSAHLVSPANGVNNGYPSGRPAKSARGGGGASNPHLVKDREAMAEEILELKKKIVRLTEEANVGKAKARRLEEDNKNKEKQLEALLDPSKSDEMRRTLGERKTDSASVIGSLKQRIFKLEQSTKDKEAALTALQKDHKSTSVHELKVQMETMYQEILRLRRVNQVIQASASARAAFAEEAAAPSTKVKALNNAILRLHSENQDMGKESLSLKTDLEVALSENETLKEKLAGERPRNGAQPSQPAAGAAAQRVENENEKLKKQIALLQDELAKINEKKKGSDSESDDNGSKAQLKALEKSLAKFKKRRADAAAAASSSSSSDKEAPSMDGLKIGLSGNWIECLDALDLREAELLEEVDRAKASGKKAREEKLNWKKKASEANAKTEREAHTAEEAKEEADNWKKKCERLEANLAAASATKSSKSPRTTRDRHPSESSLKGVPDRSTPSRANTPPSRAATPTSSRRGASSSPLPSVGKKADPPEPPSDAEEEEEKRRLEEEEEEEERRRRRKRSRERQRQRRLEEEEEEENKAASVIQKRWKSHRRRKEEAEERFIAEDVTRVQSALRGHVSRAAADGRGLEEEDESAALALQAAVRGHMARSGAAARNSASRPTSGERKASRSRSPPALSKSASSRRTPPPPSRTATPPSRNATPPSRNATPPSRNATPREGGSKRAERKSATPRLESTSKNAADDESTDDDADVMF